jgi:hypothetical protein
VAANGPTKPTGAVQFAIDGVPFGPAIALLDGAATSPANDRIGAGSHVISASYTGDATFAASVATPLTLDVAGAPPTVKVRDTARVYGQANPAFTASYSGFVSGQGPSDLEGTLAFTTVPSLDGLLHRLRQRRRPVEPDQASHRHADRDFRKRPRRVSDHRERCPVPRLLDQLRERHPGRHGLTGDSTS